MYVYDLKFTKEFGLIVNNQDQFIKNNYMLLKNQVMKSKSWINLYYNY